MSVFVACKRSELKKPCAVEEFADYRSNRGVPVLNLKSVDVVFQFTETYEP